MSYPVIPNTQYSASPFPAQRFADYLRHEDQPLFTSAVGLVNMIGAPPRIYATG